jgi:hypothetical protein
MVMVMREGREMRKGEGEGEVGLSVGHELGFGMMMAII